MNPWLLIGGGLALAGAASIALGSTSSAPQPGVPKGFGPVFSPIAAKAVDAQTAARHKANTEVMRQAFVAEMGRDPNDAELQYAMAIAGLESSWGRGWKGAMVGSNNWGAVQCRADAQQAAGCIPYQDSFSTGEKYSIAFRSYPTPVDGARDVIKHVFKVRPRTAQALAEKEACIFRASLAMRRESYYGGFCPKATSRFSASAIKAKENRNPQSEAAIACEMEASELHAKRVAQLVSEIAPAAGLTIMSLCDYKDAVDWFQRGQPKAQQVPGVATSGPIYIDSFTAAFSPLSIFDEPTRLRKPLSW